MLITKHFQLLTSQEYEADEWCWKLNHVADFEAWEWSLAWEWNNTSRIFTHKYHHKIVIHTLILYEVTCFHCWSQRWCNVNMYVFKTNPGNHQWMMPSSNSWYILTKFTSVIVQVHQWLCIPDPHFFWWSWRFPSFWNFGNMKAGDYCHISNMLY